MNREKHNGWTNYETWVVALWIDNDQGSHEATLELAREILKSAEPGPDHGSGPIWSARSDAMTELGDALKDLHEELAEGATGIAGVLADLLNAALSEVDWYSIAEHYIDMLDEHGRYEAEKQARAEAKP